MESMNSHCEVTKSFQIKEFSSYSTSSAISSEVSVTIDDFGSSWLLTVFPMHLDKSNIENPINCDVVISLTCVSSTAPVAYLENLEISCIINGRENYPKQIKRLKTASQPTWKDILISRVTLQSCTNLLIDNCFRFQVHFCVGNEILSKSENGAKQIGVNLGQILVDPKHYDTCLISVSGSKFLVHAAILQARSNFIKASIINAAESGQDVTEDSIDKLANLSSQFVSNSQVDSLKSKNNLDNCSSVVSPSSEETGNSSYNSSHSKPNCGESPYKRTPLFVVSSSVEYSPKSNKRTLSPSISSPGKRRGTPRKRLFLSGVSESPKKMQTQLTNYFQRCSSMKNEYASSDIPSSTLQKVAFLSPIKCLSQDSPTVESKLRNMVDSPRNKNAKENHIDTFSPFKANDIIRSPCGTKTSQFFQNSNKNLANESETSNKKLTVINVKMSSSVTQELLRWIYTGESPRLAELSRPLMVAAIRYEVPSLSRAAQLHLSSILCVENCSELLVLGHKYIANILKEDAMQYAIAYASNVTSLLAWAELSLRYSDLMLEFTRRLAAKPL